VDQIPERVVVFYTRKISGFVSVLDFVPEIRTKTGSKRDPSELKTLEFDKPEHAHAVFCLLNSTLFKWFITVFSDCRNLNRRDILLMPVELEELTKRYGTQLTSLSSRLSASLRDTSEIRAMTFDSETLRVQCIFPKYSKSIIDEIDRVLASYFQFDDDEIDFIINFQIKYRMGREAAEGEDATDGVASN